MQNDLISRSALIKKLSKNSIFTKVTNAEDKNVIDIVNSMPCAYDVEKVVAKLEELRSDYFQLAQEQEEKDKILYGKYIQKSFSYRTAIEIVRNGGKE